jgi:organic radical activating enzyme
LVKTVNIQWNIGNICNLNCEYCPSSLKDGQAKFPTVDQFTSAIENIQRQTVNFDTVEIELTGGEPTLSDAVRECLSSSIDKIKFRFHSNGTAEVAWWQQALPNFNEITLSLHSQANFDHYVDVANTLHGQCNLKLLIAMDVDNFDAQQTRYNILKDKFSEVRPQMLYSNFTKGNNRYLDYTDAQWRWYFSEHGICCCKRSTYC